jgi:DNA-binding response OmpR family regulator
MCPANGIFCPVSAKGAGHAGWACARNDQGSQHSTTSSLRRIIMDNLFMQSTTVLLVEDDADLRAEVKDYLVAEGFKVLEAASLQATFEILQTQQVQLMVLDASLQDGNALTALPEIRRSTDCPIVMMTAWGQLPQRLQGLQQGADYYLVKPVPLSELCAVLTTLLRRSTAKVSWGSNTITRELVAPNGKSIQLTPSEWVFVQLLRQRPGIVINRQELVLSLGHEPVDYDSRRMDTLLQRLRKKAEQAGMGSLPLHTRHGQGYVWEAREAMR